MKKPTLITAFLAKANMNIPLVEYHLSCASDLHELSQLAEHSNLEVDGYQLFITGVFSDFYGKECQFFIEKRRICKWSNISTLIGELEWIDSQRYFDEIDLPSTTRIRVGHIPCFRVNEKTDAVRHTRGKYYRVVKAIRDRGVYFAPLFTPVPFGE